MMSHRSYGFFIITLVAGLVVPVILAGCGGGVPAGDGRSPDGTPPLAAPGAIGGFCYLGGIGPAGDHSGTIVSLDGTDYTGTTAPDGHFIISQMPEDEEVYRVSFSHEGYESVAYPNQVQVPASGTASLSSPVTLPLLVSGDITGTVKAQEGLPLSGIMVRVETADRFAKTRPDGVFIIEGMKPGTYDVVFRHELVKDEFRAESLVVAGREKTFIDAQLTDQQPPAWEGTPGVVCVHNLADFGEPAAAH